jgi:SAM-dependent methyltransferase
MAENYRFRPPHPAEVYDTLLELMRGHPRIIFDAGCGTGKITLGLIDHLDRADAVDPFDAMLRVARSFLFERRGYRITGPVSSSQSIADYLRCQHSRSAWSEDQLGAKASAEFDAEITILNRYARNGVLTFDVQTRMDWGRVRRS